MKEWRKKDFASQYFTMSVQQNVDADGIHWPLVLNVPGEGFGDDFLQHWESHRVLEELEADEFLLDEAFIASGGSCPQRVRNRTSDGPPTGQVAHVPSNLEVDPAAWRDIVHTGSPIWRPPPVAEAAASGASTGAAATIAEVAIARGAAGALACLASVNASGATVRLRLRVELEDAAWIAVGFRRTEECLMTPRGGGDGEVVYAWPEQGGAEYSMRFGQLPPTLKSFSGDSGGRFLANLDTFGAGSAQDLSEASVEHTGGEVLLSFARRYPSVPEGPLQLSLAVGLSGALGYHRLRECFALEALSPCPATSAACAACSAAACGGRGAAAGDNKGSAKSPVNVPISGASILPARAFTPLLLVMLMRMWSC